MFGFGYQTIKGTQDTVYLHREHLTPSFGGRVSQLVHHKFYRGDEDPDPHDHRWSFWTFPMRDYYEEVFDPVTEETNLNVVPMLIWSPRNRRHIHRVVGPVDGKFPFSTLVWRQPEEPDTWWGFWVDVRSDHPSLKLLGQWTLPPNWPRAGMRIKVPWRTYVFGEDPIPYISFESKRWQMEQSDR